MLGLHWFGFESGSEVSPTLQQWAEWGLPGATFATVLLPIAIAGALFCFLASRSAVGWKWILAASGLIAMFGALAVFKIVLPAADHKGTLQVGLGVSSIPVSPRSCSSCFPWASALGPFGSKPAAATAMSRPVNINEVRLYPWGATGGIARAFPRRGPWVGRIKRDGICS